MPVRKIKRPHSHQNINYLFYIAAKIRETMIKSFPIKSVCTINQVFLYTQKLLFPNHPPPSSSSQLILPSFFIYPFPNSDTRLYTKYCFIPPSLRFYFHPRSKKSARMSVSLQNKKQEKEKVRYEKRVSNIKKR